MSGINLTTLMAAHAALMEAWRLDYKEPPSFDVRQRCMKAAVAIEYELRVLMPQIAVQADAPAAVEVTA